MKFNMVKRLDIPYFYINFSWRVFLFLVIFYVACANTLKTSPKPPNAIRIIIIEAITTNSCRDDSSLPFILLLPAVTSFCRCRRRHILLLMIPCLMRFKT